MARDGAGGFFGGETRRSRAGGGKGEVLTPSLRADVGWVTAVLSLFLECHFFCHSAKTPWNLLFKSILCGLCVKAPLWL